MDMPVLLRNKSAESPSVFRPSALLREARRQKGILEAPVPPVCLLDPDGESLAKCLAQIDTQSSRRIAAE